MSSTTILAPTVQAAGATTISAAYPLALDAVIQCECQNPGSPLLSPCLVSLLLSGDGGVTFCPVETRRFESTALSAFESFSLREQADKKAGSATVWYTAAGVTSAPGNLRSFKPPWDHYMLLFAGNLGGSVTVSAVADGASVTQTGFTIAQYTAPITTDSDGATITFDLSVANAHQVTLGGNRTLAVANAQVGEPFTIILNQDGSGSRTVTWFSGIRWPSGTVPTLTNAPLKADVFVFRCISSGSYLGFIAGQNL